MRLVPHDEVLAKLAAIQSADALGRQFAQDQAMEKLASMAGIFMAHTQTEEGMDKLAQAMVDAGELTPEEYEMLKEAGLGRLFRAAVSKGKGALQRTSRRLGDAALSARMSMSGAKSRVGSVFKRKPKIDPSKRTGPIVRRRRGGQVTELKPRVQGATSGQTGRVQAAAPKVQAKRPAGQPPAPKPAPAPKQAPQQAAQAPVDGNKRVYSWETQGGAPGRVKPAPAQAARPAPAASAAPQQGPVQAPAAAPGRVPHASQPKPRGPEGRAAAKQRQQAAKQQQQAQAKQQAAAQQPAAQPAAKGKSKGMTWGKALPWMAVGGLGYGLYKGVPWAARQMEQASTTPMAYGGGWSPVPYGYGHTPYGPGSPNMGMGT